MQEDLSVGADLRRMGKGGELIFLGLQNQLLCHAERVRRGKSPNTLPV